ncbi:MAG: hypothetical protein BAJALOKI3v1_440010 [Promethearchaeota archaeon]|nr:MAG: hypothetical protein BAJALOKI3v1_440010 [Candidatus Lokiarchaeota archaeon]
MISIIIYLSIAIVLMIMVKLFFDACSLIYITKINLKEHLPALGKIYVSQSVKEELISDLERFDDAKVLNENINHKLINIRNFKRTNRFSNRNLGLGEKDTIELCLKEDGVLVTDDHKALNLALGIGLKPKTSEIILLDFLKNSIISYENFKNSFWELARIKTLNPEIIAFLFDKAKEMIKPRNQNKGEK